MKGNNMNYVKQAYELAADKKVLAKELYEQAVTKLVSKTYTLRIYDAHTDLSAIFGELWLLKNKKDNAFLTDWSLYAEANVAFNYANLTLGIGGRFKELALEVNESTHLIDEIELQAISDSLNFVLTDTGTDDSLFTTH